MCSKTPSNDWPYNNLPLTLQLYIWNWCPLVTFIYFVIWFFVYELYSMYKVSLGTNNVQKVHTEYLHEVLPPGWLLKNLE